MLRVLIIGAGGHAQVVADILLRAHAAGEAALPVGYIDNNPALQGKEILGLPVLGVSDQRTHCTYEGLIVAIGDNQKRQTLIEQFEQQGERLIIACHPAAIVSPDVRIGAGTMICAGAIVNTGSVIGSGVILNTGCTLDHHNQIDDAVHVAPGVHTGGDVSIGKGTLVGIGTTVMPRCHIGQWSIIGAGSVVTTNIPDNVVAVGSPAKVIKERKV